MEHNQNSSTEIRDKPQDAGSVQSNNEVSNILWAHPKGIKPRAIHRHFGPFPARPEKVFHIDNNGQVIMVFLLNMEDFDGEVRN